MKYRDLLKNLARGETSPAYVFAGGSHEEQREAIGKLREILVDGAFDAFNYIVHYGRESSPEEIVTDARTPAMGPGSRLVVLREGESLSAAERKKLLPYLAEPEPGNCLVISTVDLNLKKDAFIKAAREMGVLVDFSHSRRESLAAVIQEHLNRRGLTASPEVVKALEETVGDDRDRMARELDKLAVFAGEDKRLELEDVRDLLVGSRQQGIFDLTRCLQRRDAGQAIRILNKLLEEGESPVGIVHMMARQYRLLWMAREEGRAGGKAAFPELTPWIKRELAGDANKFSSGELAQTLLALLELDRRLKSSSTPPAILLEAFLAERG